MSECAFPCTGDAASQCGGYYAYHAFELGALDQPAGHLGCYTDDKHARVFAAPLIRTGDNTAEVCDTHDERTTFLTLEATTRSSAD